MSPPKTSVLFSILILCLGFTALSHADEAPCAGLLSKFASQLPLLDNSLQLDKDRYFFKGARSWERLERSVDFSVLDSTPMIRPVVGSVHEGNWSYFHLDDAHLAFSDIVWTQECGEAPCARWTDNEGGHKEAVNSFVGRSVYAIGCTKDFWVLALQRNAFDSIITDVDWVFWDTRKAKSHAFTTGDYELTSFLPDWEQTNVGQVKGALVIRSEKGALVFWPDAKEWAPVDPRDGKSIPDELKMLKQARPTKDRLSVAELKAGATQQVLKFFAEQNPELTESYEMEHWPQELLLYNLGKPEAYYCFCTSMYNSKRAFIGEDPDWPSQHLFGCFLASQRKPLEIFPLGFFPSQRRMDYSAYCMKSNHSNEVVIRSEGASYGDGAINHRFQVDPKSRIVTKIGG